MDSQKSMSVFTNWVTIFPGKSGMSWLIANNQSGTKEEMELLADKNCNVIAVPLSLYEHINDIQHGLCKAETILNQIRVDAQNWYSKKLHEVTVSESDKEQIAKIIINDIEFD